MADREVNITFKILSMLGIIFVVDGYIGGNMQIFNFNNLFPYYSFHLALFVFISGYFYSHKSKDNIIGYIYKKFKNLIIPFFIWNIVYGLIAQLLHMQNFKMGESISISTLLIDPFTNGHQFGYNLATWFCVPLFLVQVFNVIFRKIFSFVDKKEFMIFIVYALIGIFGVKLAVMGYNKDFMLMLVRTMFFVPCFELGVLYRNRLEKYDRCNSVIYFSVIIVIQLIMVFSYEKITYTVSWSNDFVNGCVQPYISAILGIAFWLRISKLLVPVFENSKLMLAIANNTFSIMTHHILGFMLLKTVFATLYQFGIACNNFDMTKYKTNIWYYYFPHDLVAWRIVYVAFAIAFSLFIKYTIDKVVCCLKGD